MQKRKEKKLYKNTRTKFSAQFQFWRSLKSSFGTGLEPTMANKSVASIGTTNKKENLTIIGKREHWNKSQSCISQVL